MQLRFRSTVDRWLVVPAFIGVAVPGILGILDHVSDVGGKPGPLIFGIYETGGGMLTIAMIPPTPDGRRLTRFESKPADGSRMLILKRVSD